MPSDKTKRFVAIVTGRSETSIDFIACDLQCSRRNVYRLVSDWARHLPIRTDNGIIVNEGKKR